MGAQGEGNPYAGPRPFVEGEQLYGRDAEIASLFYRLSAERIVVLHSPSGAGKSSLLNAGLLPRLKEDGFDVWPVVRLNAPAVDGRNPFVASALLSLGASPAEVANGTLAHFVDARLTERGSRPVLIFDQFEEILTLAPFDLGAKQKFFRELGEALKNARVWALLALREDYLGALDPYRDDVPTRLGNTFRIDLLTVGEAGKAIAGPAHDAGREFAPDAAAKLAKDLATVSVQQPDGSFEQQPGIYVEPLQLQVVCRRLWDELSPATRTIGVENLLDSGDVDAALAAYYAHSVAEIAGTDVATERSLREWFSDRLITPGGIRAQVLREQGTSGGLDNHSIDRLVETHLVRSEQRDGKTWFELAHDRLVDPVRSSNTTWLEKHLHPMQRQAALWEREGRPESLLLRGQELEDAESWARDNATFVRPIETDLLIRSTRQRQAERRRRRTLGAIAVGLLALVALFAALGVWALVQRDHARSARTSAGVFAAASSADDPTTPLDVSLLLSFAAYAANPRSGQVRSSAVSALEAAYASGFATILDGHTDVVLDVAYSRDGRTLASAGDDGTVRLWDVRARRPLSVLRGTIGPVNSVAFSPDRQTLASAGADGVIRLWQVRSHRLLSERQSGGAVNSVAFSHDGQMLASAGINGLSLWDVRRDRVLGLLGRVAGKFQAVAFDPDGPTLASVGFSDAVSLWKMPSLQPRPGYEQDGAYFVSVAYGPDGTLAAGTADGTVHVWGPNGRHSMLGGQGWAYGVAFGPDGTLASSTGDGTIRLWNLSTHRSIRILGSAGADPLLAVAFSPDGRTVASAGPDREIRIWPVHRQPQITQQGSATSVAFSPDRSTLAAGGDDGTIRLWNVRTHGLKGVLPFAGAGVTALAFSRDGTLASAYSSRDGSVGTIRLWNTRTHGKLASFGTDGGIIMIAFSRDGHTLASVSHEGVVRLWDLHTRPPQAEELQRPDGFTHTRWALALSPKGERLASRGPGSTGYTIRLWNVGKGEHKPLDPPLRGHTFWVTAAAFSPDGRTLASASWDGTVRLWDVQSHRLLGVLRGHTSFVESVAFSPDGRTIASAGDDSTVRLWDVLTHRELGRPLRVGGIVNDVAFSPDGLTLAAASDDGTVGLWQNILFHNLTDLRARVCGLVVGSPTRAEWKQYAPGLPHRTICPS